MGKIVDGRLPRAVVTLVVVALLTLGSPVPPDAAQAQASADRAPVSTKAYGFTAGAPILTMSDAALASQLDASVEAGGTWLRMPMSWLVAEPSQGVFDWTRLDRVVEAARSRGLKVLGVLGGTPAWASASGSPAAPPTDPALFGAFAGAAARHFKGRVRHWEVWNEPNFNAFFTGSAADYADLLAQAHGAVKQVQRRSKIVLGGLARYLLGRSARPATFLQEVYDAGGGPHFDVLGVHPYVQAALAGADEVTVWREVEDARRVMRDEGNRKRKVWVTEIGWSTWLAGWTQARAADQAIALLERASSTRWLGVTILYSIQDRRTNITAVHDNYGSLLTASGGRKILFDRLAAGR